MSSSRARRATAKAVNYAKEQEFSDEDIFGEDGEVEQQPAPSSKRGRSKARKSKSADASSSAHHHHHHTPGGMAADEDDMYGDHRPVYSEKGYDASLPPIRERFPFLPEYEEDGSPKIDLIVGRRPVDEKEDADAHASDEDGAPAEDEKEDEEQQANGGRKTRKSRGAETTTPKKKKKKSKKRGGDEDDDSPKKRRGSETASPSGPAEYEYLVKYKGRSYLHLEWKTGADLESMNKSAKGIYRRYVKKCAAGVDEDLESPDFDPLFVVPEKVLDEADQEVTIELTDKELLKWEKEREKELEKEAGDDDDDDEEDKSPVKKDQEQNGEKEESKPDEEKKGDSGEEEEDWPDGVDFKNVTVDHLRKILKKEGPFYPVVKGSDNPYRDGYVTEPPKKPRASYLFFQCTVRSYFAKQKPNAVQSELMAMLGEGWRSMNDQDKEKYQILADEEAKQYNRERVLLEKAQKPNGVWQPLRRCRQVLERLAKDSFADIFLEPVDLEQFPDYEEMIDIPMDLGTVRKRLETKKYMAPEQFARDMRRVWNNCKIYNQHGSAIWHVADYMSKQFERLYHAWVLEFRERYLRWADPRARPWEHSCRMHDGKCGTLDDKMVLCDHCDSMYGFQCLKPPLKKVPTKAWHCPDCKPKLKSTKGTRMLSAEAESAARKRAELGDIPRKKITRTMYLVKWAGLGYEFCTWETKEDVGNDALIAAFQKLNHGYSDEADMPEEMIDEFLGGVTHVNAENAEGTGVVPVLRSQLYAQTRGLQFLKFGMDMPEKVSNEMGPKTHAAQSCSPVLSAVFEIKSDDLQLKHPRPVTECVSDLVFRVARKQGARRIRGNTSLPPPLSGEYDAVVPITSKGLMMNVGEIHGAVSFLGYRRFPDKSKGPAEIAKLIKNVGDKIVAVDGVSTVGKSFKDVIGMLRESGKNKFAFMRFLESRFSCCDDRLSSVGVKGQYAFEELQKKFATDRQRIMALRKSGLDEDDHVDSDDNDEDHSAKEEDSDAESGDDDSEGEFRPDSDDEELVVEGGVQEVSPSHKMNGGSSNETPTNGKSDVIATEPSKSGEDQKPLGNKAANEVPSADKEELAAATEKSQPLATVRREETTRSLALRLLDFDLGYSSDEAGDEESAFFLDGVDETFTSKTELEIVSERKVKAKDKKKQVEGDDGTIPASKTEFAGLGEHGKLAVAVALSNKAPSADDFDEFPAVQKKVEETVVASPLPSKSTKRSLVKVEQVSSSGETIHVWPNVEAAAATLQLPLPQLRQVLLGEYDEDIGEEVGGFKWRYALAGAKVTAGNTSSSRGGGGKKAKEAWLEFRDKLYDPSEPHAYKNGNKLRDYQVDGVNWLASTWYKRQGAVLADEMGLGKTVQIICYIEHIFRVEKIRRPFLVVVPLSTVQHWRREFEGWTDMVCCIYHDRQRVWRDVMREYEWYYEDRPHTPEFLKFDVLVTTYDTLIGDFDVISQIPFRVAVVDEAHRLRNQKGKLLECMREISAKGTMQYGFQSRVLMSGTPLQNDLGELWTLLNFIEPFKFPDLDDFQASFGNMANRSQVEALQKIISPFMLRRVKEDVAKDIPAKEETVIDVELTSFQKQYYRAVFEHNHAFLNMGGGRQTAPKLMNIQMELRKVCNHPFLLEGVEHRETDRQFKEFLENGQFEGKTPEEQQHMLNEHGYIHTSGKMVLLDKLLPKLHQEGHKILIFSQMVKMIDLIAEYCEFRDFRYERLDGRVRGTDRQKAIDRFETEEDSFLFLLSTRAGGVGINLTAADICIIFDSDWNPQNDVQAQARCHRIGQTKDVRIYRLVTSRSFEQEMFDRASKKLGLEQAVLGTFEKDQDDDKPSHQEMEQLLKKGAYALLEDEDDRVTQEFCADDIESILAKRTRTRVVEGAKTASWLNKQGMVVSKSKFSAETGDTLDMDDPNFWAKVMPDFVTSSLLLDKLRDIEDEIEGKVRGPGRGRGRKKKVDGQAATPVKASGTGADEAGERVVENGEAKANGTGPDDKDVKLDGSEAQADGTIVDKEDVKVDGSEAQADGTSADKDEHNDDGEEKAGKESESAEDAPPSPEKPEGPAEDLDEEDNADEAEDEEEEEGPKEKKFQLSRAQSRKIQKFMSDLKSLMESTFDEEEEEGISPEEKNACQKLLLTVSVKAKIFNEEQRHLAKRYLKRLEGDRRRRCRTSEQPRFRPGAEDDAPVDTVREELLIVGKKRKKRRKKGEIADSSEPSPKRQRRSSDNSGGYLGEDGYLHHSDSEEDWSDVGEDIYQTGGRKDVISRKESLRRRHWTAGDDSATAAGRAWPVFPRHVVKKVLATVLDEVIKYDKEKGGIFSVPVPKDEFPEYYEQIKKPMDYGTMKAKLESGGYRSAQSLQKDFILILQNCRQFNADSSDIVREARRQHLMRPKVLKDAAAKHNLFLAEDGSVLEIVDEKPGSAKKKKKKKGRDDDEKSTPKKKKGKKKKQEVEDDGDESGDDDAQKKTRIRIKVKAGASGEKSKKKKKKASKRKRGDDADGDASVDSIPIPRKKKHKKSTAKKDPNRESDASSSDDDLPLLEVAARKNRSAAAAQSESEAEEEDSNSVFLNLELWKNHRETLDGTFASARRNFTRFDGWALPSDVPGDKFSDVAKFVLNKMEKYDRYSIFEEEVTDEEAPGYSEVVTNPMDFGKMRKKIEKGEYGSGTDAATAFYNDFKLVFDNCYLYNDDGNEVTEEASRILGLLPETYVAACIHVANREGS